MKNMTLGVKIAMGFAIILVIAALLGGMGVINMNNATTNAEKMSGAYVPEVEIANGIERNFLKARLSMVNYIYTEDDNRVMEAKTSFKRAMERLNEAKELVKQYPWLVVLAEKVAEADKQLNNYHANIEKLEDAYHRKEEVRSRLDSAAALYMEQSQNFLTGQYNAMQKDIGNIVSSDKLKERMHKITWSTELIQIGTDLRIANFSAAARRDISRLNDGVDAFDKSFEPKIAQLRTITRLPEDIKRIDDIQAAGHTYADALKELLQINQEVAEINKQLVTSGMAALKAAEETARAGVGGTKNLAAESSSALQTASMTMVIGLIAALIIGILVAVFIIRSITKPVTEAVSIIADSNGQVVIASNQISSSAQSLAEGASNQASSVEEVSATIEESTAINNQNSENAREADTLAKEANHAATTGNEKVKQLMTAMEKITESSERIAKIIKTIDEIAFQTNLLALNAAVEAARAGEHGLGFAVVADEVKNLAQRSADAAKETAGIIEEAIDEIKTGNQIARDTDTAFSEILDKAEKTSGLISEIAVSIKEQAEGMNQVAGAMGQIDQVTQTNAATSEEAAAAAEELNAQANAMMDNVHSIAKIVGFQIQTDTSSTTYRKPARPIHVEHKPQASAPAKKAPKLERKNNKDEVFPLDEDDLKEF